MCKTCVTERDQQSQMLRKWFFDVPHVFHVTFLRSTYIFPLDHSVRTYTQGAYISTPFLTIAIIA